MSSEVAYRAQAAARDDGLAPGGFDPYLHRTWGALADPINLLFRGDLAAATTAVQQVLGWYPVDGSMLLFVDHSGTHPAAAQLGFNLPGGSRYHIRLGAVEYQHGRPTVLAGVHRDDSHACGHVGLAFAAVRDLVATAFAQAGYATSRLELHNTRPGPQCDGSYTAGDGTAVVIDLGNR